MYCLAKVKRRPTTLGACHKGRLAGNLRNLKTRAPHWPESPMRCPGWGGEPDSNWKRFD